MNLMIEETIKQYLKKGITSTVILEVKLVEDEVHTKNMAIYDMNMESLINEIKKQGVKSKKKKFNLKRFIKLAKRIQKWL